MKSINASRREFLRLAAQLSVAGVAAPFALNLASIGAAAAAVQPVTDYRALVCVFLFGANDHNNTVIPYDSSNYALYNSTRASIARSVADLLPLTPQVPLTGANAGRQFALPKELAALKPWWDNGNLAILANVGPLIMPITKAQYTQGKVLLPPKLFSHNDQQSIWQASAPEGARYGWGGRLGDLFAANNFNSTFTCNSISGRAIFLAGQNTIAYQLSSIGSITINGLQGKLFGSSAGATALKTLLTRSNDSLLNQDVVAVTQRAITTNQVLTAALAGVPELALPEDLANNSLATQLRMVARMIAAKDALGAKRQVFFVSLGGFDTHDNQLTVQPGLHSQLAAALNFFHTSLTSLGLNQQVTSFTASDFGRTLVSNGDGSDHGWGGHHFILGGAVQGQRFYGTFPAMGINNDDEVGSGRLLPSTSVEQYAATLARWFGVSETDLSLVLPNIGNFSNTNLGFMRA